MGSQHPSPNVKNLCNFETQIWLEIITSREAQRACFKGSQTSCAEIISCFFLGPRFGRKTSHHVMDASCWFYTNQSSELDFPIWPKFRRKSDLCEPLSTAMAQVLPSLMTRLFSSLLRKSEWAEWRRLFYRGAPESSKSNGALRKGLLLHGSRS